MPRLSTVPGNRIGRQVNLQNCYELLANTLHIPCPSALLLLPSKNARPKDFATRDMIFVAGDPAKEVFLLVSGRVRIMQFCRNVREGIVRLERPGELIDVMSSSPSCPAWPASSRCGPQP
ncbi:MAG: hypothetical protein DMG41_03580 [Acidobacteria bacterium]|nr:MAG: hypothetical protein DMG41_03580 [Acidobacteriota bacterium]